MTQGAWYAESAGVAASVGIILDYEEGNFHPNGSFAPQQTASRAEANESIRKDQQKEPLTAVLFVDLKEGRVYIGRIL